MQNMKYYYDFSGQRFGYPLSLSINSFSREIFSRHNSLEITYVLKGEYEVITENFSHIIKEHELVIIAPLVQIQMNLSPLTHQCYELEKSPLYHQVF